MDKETNGKSDHGVTHVEQLEDVKDAQLASTREKEIGFLESIKESRKAVVWSAIISLTIIMEGYDVGK